MTRPEKISSSIYDDLYLAICFQMPFECPDIPADDAYGKTIAWSTAHRPSSAERICLGFALFDIDAIQPPFFDPQGLHIASCGLTIQKPGYEKSEQYWLMQDGSIKVSIQKTEDTKVARLSTVYERDYESTGRLLEILSGNYDRLYD